MTAGHPESLSRSELTLSAVGESDQEAHDAVAYIERELGAISDGDAAATDRLIAYVWGPEFGQADRLTESEARALWGDR